VRRPQLSLPTLEHPLVQLLRLLVPALVLVDDRQILRCPQRVKVCRPQPRLPALECPLIQLLRLLVSPLT
jgi:hypothetical protein